MWYCFGIGPAAKATAIMIALFVILGFILAIVVFVNLDIQEKNRRIK